MADTSYLKWPFFEAHHARLAQSLDAWARQNIAHSHGADVDAECRQLVKALGEAGWLRHAVAGTAYGGAGEHIDTRAICLIRETLARLSGLAVFAFAMLGLGSGAISLAGSEEQKKRYLRRVARGEAIGGDELLYGTAVANLVANGMPLATIAPEPGQLSELRHRIQSYLGWEACAGSRSLSAGIVKYLRENVLLNRPGF